MRIKRIVCDPCKIIFHSKKVKLIHDQLVHKKKIVVSEENSILPTFKCSVEECPHFFTHLSDYNRHFGVYHSRQIIKKQEKRIKETEEIVEGQRHLLNNQEMIITLLEQQVQVSNQHIEALKTQIEDTILCKICYVRSRNMCFRPCKHIYCCTDCGNDPSIDTCPVCTLLIRKKEKVYFP